MEFKVKNSAELYNALGFRGKKRITVKGGKYEIDRTLVLDSDTEIISDGAHFYGTRKISLDGTTSENGIYKIKLSNFGISDLGAFGLGPYREYWKEHDIPKPNME